MSITDVNATRDAKEGRISKMFGHFTEFIEQIKSFLDNKLKNTTLIAGKKPCDDNKVLIEKIMNFCIMFNNLRSQGVTFQTKIDAMLESFYICYHDIFAQERLIASGNIPIPSKLFRNATNKCFKNGNWTPVHINDGFSIRPSFFFMDIELPIIEYFEFLGDVKQLIGSVGNATKVITELNTAISAHRIYLFAKINSMMKELLSVYEICPGKIHYNSWVNFLEVEKNFKPNPIRNDALGNALENIMTTFQNLNPQAVNNIGRATGIDFAPYIEKLKNIDSEVLSSLKDTVTSAIAGSDGDVTPATLIDSLNSGKALNSLKEVGEKMGLLSKEVVEFGNPDEQC